MTATLPEREAGSTGGRFHRLRYGRTRALCGVVLVDIIERQAVDQVPDNARCIRCWRRPIGARLEASSMAQRQGIRATSDGGVCPRCDHPVLKEQRIVKRGEVWIHAACHNQEHE